MRMPVRHVFCHLPRSRIFAISNIWKSLIVGWRIGEVFTGANGVRRSIEKVRFFFPFLFLKFSLYYFLLKFISRYLDTIFFI